METATSACPACQSSRITTTETLSLWDQFSLYAEGDSDVRQSLLDKSGLSCSQYQICQCEHCGLLFSNPMESPSGEWYSYAYNRLNFHASNRWEFSYVIDRLAPLQSVGEIGCGTGVFLAQCTSKNVHASGLDFSPESVEVCRSKGLVAHLGDVAIIDYSTLPKVDVVASFHVLEHLADPAQIFRIASAWSQPDSSLWIGVPSNFRIDRIFRIKHLLDEPPHHLTRWSRDSLVAIGKATGWSLQKLIYEEIPFRQRLYNITVHTQPYKSLKKLLPPWRMLDRVLRYGLYGATLLFHFRKVSRLTGFSMLAEFRRRETP